MRPGPAIRIRRTAPLCVLLAVLVVLAAAGPAAASPGDVPAPVLANIFGDIAHAVLGAVDWTVDVAGDFVMNLFGGIVKKLIPRSWIDQGVPILSWIVAVPDYSARLSTPTGAGSYGFAGVNEMRGLFTWLGMAIAPLALVFATSRSIFGQSDQPAVPMIRVFTVAIGVLSYTWLWGQAVAITNQITKAILGVGAVAGGIEKMFDVLIAGTVLRGLPFIGLILMAIGAIGLIAMLFLKVMIVLVGALVYATGPLMLGLAATERGNAVARAWMSLATGLFALAIIWASVFALAAVLINDAATGAGAVLFAGSSGLRTFLGGLIIAMAAIAGFILNLKITKALGGVVGAQLSGMLALIGSQGGVRGLLGAGAARATGGGASGSAAAAGASLRGFGAKARGAAAGAASALSPVGRGAGVLAGAGTLGRGGLIGAGGALAGAGASRLAGSRVGQAAATSRAGSVATQTARGTRRGWKNPSASTDQLHNAAAADKTARASTPAAPTSPPPSRSAPQPRGRPGGGTGDADAPTAGPPAPPATSSPRGRARATPRGRSPKPPTPPPSSPTSPRDASNEAARAAFGEPRADAKPTRRGRRKS